MGLIKTGCRSILVSIAILVLACFGCSTKNWTAKDWADKGSSLGEQSNYRDAVQAYTRSIEKDAAYGPAYQNRGCAHSALGNYRQAVADFTKVLSLNDKRVPARDSYRELGVVYFKMGQLEDAIAAWKKGLGPAKDDPGILDNIAAAYLRMGQTDKAAQAATAAYSVDPSMPEVLNTLGEIAMTRKQFRQAADYFVGAIDREPRRPAYYRNAALAFEGAKQYDKALEYARQYADGEKDPASRQQAGEIIERLMKPRQGAAHE